ncbi:MAG TPA: tetratricopeptide repeat protein, partial [Kofleriaceae bacterium]
FDGHGVYDRNVGLGGLCFERPEDEAKLEDRRHQTIFTDQLGSLLRDHRIPLVYLDACQTAQAEQVSESVASEMLQRGVTSVISMSHSVLAETARRFVTAFYAELARGGRVGAAMLEGQRHLKDDTLRDRIFGAGELRLEDWFVPVLFQEKEDPQLFRQTPANQTRVDFQTGLQNRLGELPPPPSTGFIGRSRDLLALERLLRHERYAVLRGQGGEGKTALAAEFARWMVRSQRFRRSAFLSVEAHATARAVLDALGRQLVPGYSVATFASLEHAEEPVARALVEQPTLLVVDNLESILQPPYVTADTPEALAEDDRDELAAILALCERLNRHGETRFVFTSREALPAPFDDQASRRELHRLHRNDAVHLVERVVHEGAATAGVADAERAAIEDLVEAVHGHARTLALLAPSLRRVGVAATREALVELMTEMDRRFPGQREQSLFASVELSLRRLSPDARSRARVLGVFHGGVDLDLLRVMMGWERADAASLARELVDTGLATPNRYNHLSLDPALCPYLHNLLDEVECDALTARWVEAMSAYLDFLVSQRDQTMELTANLTRLQLPNLVAFLAHVARSADAEVTVELAGTLQLLLANLGLPHLLAWVGDIRDTVATRIGGTWSHARFVTERSRIEDQLASDRLRKALDGAQALLRQALTAGEHAYPGADYDIAGACWLLGRVLQMTGSAQQALPYLDEAQRRFETIVEARSSTEAARMAAVCWTERGDCLQDLGRLDEAAAAYDERIHRARQQLDGRGLAVATTQLGTVRRKQGRYRDALDAYAEAREQFTRLGEPSSVAAAWHLMGTAHREAGQPDAAEDAYRQALMMMVQAGDIPRQSRTLVELGNLYSALGRLEEAASLYRRAADHYLTAGDAQSEARCWNNIGTTLLRLGRRDEAREAIHRAIECQKPFGHTAEPWKTWANLANIEANAGHADLAAQARARASACYLAYRRDGGENHNDDGRIGLAIAAKLLAGDAAGAIADLDQLLEHPELPGVLRPFVVSLQAIAAGSRDRSVAESPDLSYTSAAELLCVLDALDA